MTSFSVDLMALTIPHLTSGMWRIVKSSCLLAQEGLILMMIVSNEHVYIYIKKTNLCSFVVFLILQSYIYYLLITIKYTKNSMFQWFHKPKLKIFIPRWLHEYLEWILILLFNWAQKYNFWAHLKGKIKIHSRHTMHWTEPKIRKFALKIELLKLY